jgi:hypothetical protein
MITMTGSGNSATWSGNYACPAYAITSDCGAMGQEQVITYTSATATLDDSSLTVIASGTVAGCLPGDITVTFQFKAGFAGTWMGTTTVGKTDSPGNNFTGSFAQIVMAVSGNWVTVSGICPADIADIPPDGGVEKGSGIITMTTGSGRSATWSGNYACPEYVLQSCGEEVITYTSATAILDNSSLTLIASGTGRGCFDGDITVTFTSPGF